MVASLTSPVLFASLAFSVLFASNHGHYFKSAVDARFKKLVRIRCSMSRSMGMEFNFSTAKSRGRKKTLPTSGDGLFVSPLATLTFELCVVGDTGLKTGRVRCRHGAGRGGAEWLSTLLIVSVPCYKCCSSAPKISVCVSASNHFYSCALQLYSLHREVIRVLRRPFRPS